MTDVSLDNPILYSVVDVTYSIVTFIMLFHMYVYSIHLARSWNAFQAEFKRSSLRLSQIEFSEELELRSLDSFTDLSLFSILYYQPWHRIWYVVASQLFCFATLTCGIIGKHIRDRTGSRQLFVLLQGLSLFFQAPSLSDSV